MLTEEGPDLLFLTGIFIDIILGGSNPQILKLFLNWHRVVYSFFSNVERQSTGYLSETALRKATTLKVQFKYFQ